MSAKLLQAFSDENPDLQKQIGCMSGIFQMFDRHHLLTGKRLNGHNHKKLTSGHGHLKSGNLGEEPFEHPPRFYLEKSLNKSLNDNQRVSIESSRASFSSSSCSSSFSSIDCSKSTQQEHLPFEKSAYPERIARNSSKLLCSNIDTRRIHSATCNDRPNASVQSSRKSLDFRDVVKDSIYKDTCGLSVKTMRQDEVKKPVMKHRDSPRPLPLSKPIEGPYGVGITGNPRMSMDLNESLSVLEKLKEGHWYFSDAKEPPRASFEGRNGSFFSASKEAHRFSYDGREISRQSLDSRENSKYANKPRELPRLSLDSREGSVRSLNFDTKPNPILKDRNNANQRISRDMVLQQETGSRDRPRSVVAKLMGLEAMPNLSLETANSGTFDAKTNNNCFSKSMEVAKERKQDLLLQSPKSLRRDSIIPPERRHESVMKPASNSRFPIETAPWKQHDRSDGTQRRALGFREAHTKQQPETVYSEIERRLKDLEFQQSNKDLRALKQILDAIRAKGILETKKDEDQSSEVSVQRNCERQSHTGLDQNSRSASRRNTQTSHPISTVIKGTSSPRRQLESPIVLMKPAKSVNRSTVPPPTGIPLDGISGLQKVRTGDATDIKKVLINNRMAKDQSPKVSFRDPTSYLLSTDKKCNSQTEEHSSMKPRQRMLQGSSKPQQQALKENSGSSVKTPSLLSPRLQKRLELEKKSLPPVPSSDLSKPRKQSTTRQPSESVSPRSKLRSKPTQARKNDDQLSDKSETRNLSPHGDEMSLRSDSNISLASQVDIEVTSADRSANLNSDFIQQGHQSPSCRAVRNAASSIKMKKSSPGLIEDSSSTELVTITPDQPSPVSVLDPSFYRDDLSPSPADKNSDSFKGDETRNSENITVEGGWNPLGLNSRLPSAPEPNLSAEINHKKLENIENLVQKLRQLSCEDEEAPARDHIATLSETQNPDHRYVSEILLASGLLFKDLGSSPTAPVPVQLHRSGHPINPDLFLVLEQTKTDPDKLHRKLVFDTVNEILIHKLGLSGPSYQSLPRLRAGKLNDRIPSGQQLLREVCSEIDLLQTERSLSCSLEDDDDGGLKSILSEDITRQSERWKDFGSEVSGMVLDIERSIFKDLIAEVVSSEAAISGVPAKPNRRRRQLFVK